MRGVSPAAVWDVSPANAPFPELVLITGPLDGPGRVSYKTFAEQASVWRHYRLAGLKPHPFQRVGFLYGRIEPG